MSTVLDIMEIRECQEKRKRAEIVREKSGSLRGKKEES